MVPSGLPGPDKQVGRVLWPMGTMRALFPSGFKAQLAHVPADKLPADKKFNPLAFNPYVLYKALPQVKRYSETELIRAMDLLLRCNQRLVSSGLEAAFVLQQTLVQIVQPQTAVN